MTIVRDFPSCLTELDEQNEVIEDDAGLVGQGKYLMFYSLTGQHNQSASRERGTCI